LGRISGNLILANRCFWGIFKCMRDTGVDFTVKIDGKLFVGQAKSVGGRDLLQRCYAVLKNSVAHRDIKPSNIIYVDHSHSLFNWVVSSAPTPYCTASPSAKARGLTKALSVTRVGRSVRVVTTACYLLKVLKRALKIIAALIQRAITPAQPVGATNHIFLFDHGWIAIHGPRPPRQRLAAGWRAASAGSWRVHSPLAA
jgi:hypothetical protein